MQSPRQSPSNLSISTSQRPPTPEITPVLYPGYVPPTTISVFHELELPGLTGVKEDNLQYTEQGSLKNDIVSNPFTMTSHTDRIGRVVGRMHDHVVGRMHDRGGVHVLPPALYFEQAQVCTLRI